MPRYGLFMPAALCGLILLGVPAQADDQASEDVAKSFARIYFQRWSSPNAIALPYMDNVFPDHVQYFGRNVDHKVLMDAKRRFAERWPERHFAERAESLHATCDERSVCTVWGVVDWRCSSGERNASASGTSAFSFQLLHGKTVSAEDGFVVSRGQALAQREPKTAGGEPAAPAAPAARPEPKPQSPAQQAEGRAPFDNHAGPYTVDDIPRLRATYHAHSSDSNWIEQWLLSNTTFSGTARSQGPAATYSLSEADGTKLQVVQFDSGEGPIACMMAGSTPAIAQGSDVRIRGVISFFIDETMYLTACSFS